MSSTKLRKESTFSFPLTEIVTCPRTLRRIPNLIGYLEVEGIFYEHLNETNAEERYSADIDFIRWNGTDIRPVLDHFLGNQNDIYDAAVNHAQSLFTDEKVEEAA